MLTGMVRDIDTEIWRYDTALPQRDTVASGGDRRFGGGVFHYDEFMGAPSRQRAHLFTINGDRLPRDHNPQKWLHCPFRSIHPAAVAVSAYGPHLDVEYVARFAGRPGCLFPTVRPTGNSVSVVFCVWLPL